MPRLLAAGRLKASGRQVASTRFAVRNFPYSLNYNGGLSQYGLNSSGNTISGFQDFTMGMWVNINVRNSSFQRFLNIGTLTGNQFTGIQLSSANVWGMAVPGNNLNSNIVANFNVWQFVVANFAGGSAGPITIYVNNVNIYSATFPTTGIAGTNISEGALFLGTQASYSKIAQSFIYGRSLSTSEMTQIYRGGVFPAGNLMALYQHTEGSGSTVNDSSGNGNNLTLTNNPTWQTDSPMKSRIKVI